MKGSTVTYYAFIFVGAERTAINNNAVLEIESFNDSVKKGAKKKNPFKFKASSQTEANKIANNIADEYAKINNFSGRGYFAIASNSIYGGR